MSHSGKLRWPAHTIVVPLLFSLVVHGLLLLGLWFWPVRKESPALSIQSTRITLDTCILDSPPVTLLAERELPPDLLGTDSDKTFAPRLEVPSPPALHKPSAPVSGSALRKGNATGNKNESEDSNIPGSSGNLFPLPGTVGSVVYVLDRSVSMAIDRKLDFARRELIASLRRLPASVRFQVIDYNDYAERLVVDGQRDLLPAEPSIVSRAIALLQQLDAAGKTNHLAALRSGIDLRPDVLYFLTDADDLKPEEVAFITRRNQRTVVHTIELTRRRVSAPEGPLARLAHDNHGNYRRVSISLLD